MSGARPEVSGSGRWSRGRGHLVLAALITALTPAGAVAAAESIPGSVGDLNLQRPASDERMLVESDQLVYDYDNGTVSAVGNVVNRDPSEVAIGQSVRAIFEEVPAAENRERLLIPNWEVV